MVENFVASHLLKAVHFWNDIGLGDYDLYFIRDLQRREVDFLITKEEEPWILIEAKNSGKAISKNLLHFHEALGIRYAFQLALEKKPVEKNALLARKPAIIPAISFLSQLI
nr:DUF4143 domain-containing protein [Candidatus Neptunochlamydia vexilliferae]